jgi:GSH-dependent disulfide-bond oxidoreductase
MLQLYHWEPNAESARVLICLEEKQLPFTSHYVDVLALEHLRTEFVALNARGEVPLLLHAGAAYAGAGLICEYLEESFPEPAFMPRDARGRWCVRVWQKQVDEGFAASVSELAWQTYGLPRLAAEAREALRGALGGAPHPQCHSAWLAALDGFDGEILTRARARITDTVARLEAQLCKSAWLAGTAYSLADIAVYGYFNYLPALCAEIVNMQLTPRTLAWAAIIAQRPAVRAAAARGRSADAFTIAAPGPEQIRWG